MNPSKTLIKIFGSQSELARKLEISPQAVQLWIKNERIPAHRCLELERLSQNRVTRYELRPDIFGERI